jgi:3-deoxy-D-manno-octulosonate 8-phosphate phosphatase KdsC-like HAD superfamily phosphatase
MNMISTVTVITQMTATMAQQIATKTGVAIGDLVLSAAAMNECGLMFCVAEKPPESTQTAQTVESTGEQNDENAIDRVSKPVETW